MGGRERVRGELAVVAQPLGLRDLEARIGEPVGKGRPHRGVPGADLTLERGGIGLEARLRDLAHPVGGPRGEAGDGQRLSMGQGERRGRLFGVAVEGEALRGLGPVGPHAHRLHLGGQQATAAPEGDGEGELTLREEPGDLGGLQHLGDVQAPDGHRDGCLHLVGGQGPAAVGVVGIAGLPHVLPARDACDQGRGHRHLELHGAALPRGDVAQDPRHRLGAVVVGGLAGAVHHPGRAVDVGEGRPVGAGGLHRGLGHRVGHGEAPGRVIAAVGHRQPVGDGLALHHGDRPVGEGVGVARSALGLLDGEVGPHRRVREAQRAPVTLHHALEDLVHRLVAGGVPLGHLHLGTHGQAGHGGRLAVGESQPERAPGGVGAVGRHGHLGLLGLAAVGGYGHGQSLRERARLRHRHRHVEREGLVPLVVREAGAALGGQHLLGQGQRRGGHVGNLHHGRPAHGVAHLGTGLTGVGHAQDAVVTREDDGRRRGGIAVGGRHLPQGEAGGAGLGEPVGEGDGPVLRGGGPLQGVADRLPALAEGVELEGHPGQGRGRGAVRLHQAQRGHTLGVHEGGREHLAVGVVLPYLDDALMDGVVRRLGVEARSVRHGLGHPVAGACGQAADLYGLAVVEGDGVAALEGAPLVPADEVVGAVAVEGPALPVGELEGEGEAAQVVLGGEAVALHRLAHLEGAGLFRVHLAVGDHHDVEQAEEPGDVPALDVVEVDPAGPALGAKGLGVLAHRGTDVAGVGDEERAHGPAAVLVGQPVVDQGVLTVDETHDTGLGGIAGVGELHGGPVAVPSTARLRLPRGQDTPEGDVHIALGVLDHGLGELAHPGHDCDAVVGVTRVGVDGVDAHLHGDHSVVGLVALGDAGLLEVVGGHGGVVGGGRGVGPDHPAVAVLLGLAGPEYEHAVDPVHRGRGTRGHGRALAGGIVVEGEGGPVHGGTLLVHLHHAELPYLVGHVDHRAVVADEVADVHGGVAPGDRLRGGQVEAVEEPVHVVSLDRLAQGEVALLRGHGPHRLGAEARHLGDGLGVDEAVEHAHVPLGVDLEVAVGAPGQVVEGAGDAPRGLVPTEVPRLGATVPGVQGRLTQGTGEGRPPHLHEALPVVVAPLVLHGVEAVEVVAVEGQPGVRPPQHGHRQDEAAALGVGVDGRGAVGL